jgi:hypothetical protein
MKASNSFIVSVLIGLIVVSIHEYKELNDIINPIYYVKLVID